MNEYNLKENVERLIASFGYMMSSYSDDESNIHPKFENLDDICVILNGIFPGTRCKEVIFTQNLDNAFFGIRINPEMSKDMIINIISTGDIVSFTKYSLEIDSKVLDAQLTPEELAVYVLYEISAMICSNDVIDKLRSYIDIYLTSADDVISIRDSVHYYQLIIYAIKDTLTKLSSMIYKDTSEDLLDTNTFINSLEMNDVLISAHQKIISSEYGPGDSMRAPNMVLLRWMFIMYRSMDTNSNVVKDSLKDAYTLTGSKLEKFEIQKTLNAIDHIDNTVAYIKEDGNLIEFLESANIKIVNESLFGSLKRRGLRSLEDDLYTVAMNIKNLESENEAIYTMRFINTRLNILEDYLYENQDISEQERRHWNIVANKYRALREELVRKKIWNKKQYGLFWDYNQQFDGDPADESAESIEEGFFKKKSSGNSQLNDVINKDNKDLDDIKKQREEAMAKMKELNAKMKATNEEDELNVYDDEEDFFDEIEGVEESTDLQIGEELDEGFFVTASF